MTAVACRDRPLQQWSAVTAVIALTRWAVPRQLVSSARLRARIARWFACELVVHGGHRAAEQTKISNGQAPPLPGSSRHAVTGARIAVTGARIVTGARRRNRRQDRALAAAGRLIINLQLPPQRSRLNPTLNLVHVVASVHHQHAQLAILRVGTAFLRCMIALAYFS